MQLVVRHSGDGLGEIAAEKAAEVLSKALRRFSHRIERVSLYLEDINGPRGGADKQCRCVVHGARMRPIVIRDQDAQTMRLLNRVANRTVRVLRDRLARRRSRRRTSDASQGQEEE
jgi:hypothetical protein